MLGCGLDLVSPLVTQKDLCFLHLPISALSDSVTSTSDYLVPSLEHNILDSGTEGIYINANYVKKHQLLLQDLKVPIYPCNVDRTLNQNGAIHHAAILRMEMGDDHREQVIFLVTDTGNHDILLGMDWLKAYNSNINWANNWIYIDWCPLLCKPRQIPGPTIAYLLPTCDWKEQIDDDMDIAISSIDMLQHVMAHMEWQMPEIARTTVSITLAMKQQMLPSEISPKFA